MQCKIEKENRTTYDDNRISLAIGRRLVKKILHSHSGATGDSAQWVPHDLTESKMLKKIKQDHSNPVCNIVKGDQT